MARQYWVAPVPPLLSVAGVAFNTFTAYQDISTTATTNPSTKIPANFLEPGCEVWLKAVGHFSNTGTPTLSIGFFWGTAAVPLGQSNLITTTTAATAWPWILEYEGRVRAVGTSGSIYGQGSLKLGTSLTAITEQFVPVSQALRTSTIDTSIEKVVGVGAQWGTSSSSNTITVEKFTCVVVS